MTDRITVWFHSTCSKCRTLKGLLEEHQRDFEPRYYLDAPPAPEEIETLLDQLGMSDPIEIMRRKERAFTELGIEGLDRAGRLQALQEHPELLERPIVVWGDQALVARPPEKALELFEGP